MDLRWDWLRDRVAQNMFILPYIRSLLNPADFFTKALPIYRHNELAPLYVSYPPQPLFPMVRVRVRFMVRVRVWVWVRA